MVLLPWEIERLLLMVVTKENLGTFKRHANFYEVGTRLASSRMIL